MIAEYVVRISVSLLPVLLFLIILVFIDSYKLVRLRSLVRTIAAGCLTALVSVGINNALIAVIGDTTTYARYVAPVVEEILKAAFVVYLIYAKKIGFMVDSAIRGFAVGTGFAVIENLYVVQALDSSNPLIWILRGFGTAIMHGGTTAIFGIMSKTLYDRRERGGVREYLPGLVVVIVIHSIYNHNPAVSAILVPVVLPVIMLAVFYQSERATRQWLGTQFDTDQELLDIINSGKMSDSRIGHYFQSMKDRFPPEMLFDMICYLRLHVELGISAKGILLMREAGFAPTPAPDIKAKFTELKHLEESIGATGKLAVTPFLHQSSRDLWQLHMLGKS